jgi:uncharacterized repeat protein (TIGR03803 family)
MAGAGNAGARTQNEQILHAFAGGHDGSFPADGVTLDAAGNVYGTTTGGGHAGCFKAGGCGTVFRIAPDGTESVLFAFDGSDGASPQSVPFLDQSGNLYVTSTEGGGGPKRGHGTFLKISPAGQATLLYSFCPTKACPDGGSPIGRLIADKAGDLFGVAYVGGPDADGVIFEYPVGFGYKVFYAIGEPLPSGEFARDAKGNFYLATGGGGANGTGTIIKVSPDGAGAILYAFGAAGSGDGASPTGVSVGSHGALYGFTSAGGADNAGTLFAIDAQGSEQVLYSFTGGDDGGSPTGAPRLDKAGIIYGAASKGGANNDGAVFAISQNRLTVLHSFADAPDGADPTGSLFLAKDGTLYGTTFYGGREKGAVCRTFGCGTVYSVGKKELQ